MPKTIGLPLSELAKAELARDGTTTPQKLLPGLCGGANSELTLSGNVAVQTHL
jgi:hypothetical protein